MEKTGQKPFQDLLFPLHWHYYLFLGWFRFLPREDGVTMDVNQMILYKGGCHCGAVRFEVSITPSQHAIEDCNCSICRKKGFLHLIVPPEQFNLVTGQDKLTTYTFNTGTAKHTFCQVCGMHPFYYPRSHPGWIDVNVRCLDGDVLSNFEIHPFDGVNWEENVDALRAKDESKAQS